VTEAPAALTKCVQYCEISTASKSRDDMSSSLVQYLVGANPILSSNNITYSNQEVAQMCNLSTEIRSQVLGVSIVVMYAFPLVLCSK
jgi:hypothetical protein